MITLIKVVLPSPLRPTRATFSPLRTSISAPENTTFRSLAAWYLRQLPPTSERAALRKALTLAQILTRLETAPTAELELPAPEGGTYRLRCSLLEEMPGVLLVTCRQVPSDGTPAPQA